MLVLSFLWRWTGICLATPLVAIGILGLVILRVTNPALRISIHSASKDPRHESTSQ